MFGNNKVNGRPVGVGIPEGQRRAQADTGAPGAVLHFVEAQTFAVQYVDQDGRARPPTLVHRIGGVWHLAPNGENYAATLRPVAADSRLAKNLEERFVGVTTTNTIPKEDAVDVIDPSAEG